MKKWITLILMLTPFGLISASTCGRFQAIEVLENQSAHSPVLADLNGDGKQDLALLNPHDVLSLRFGNGDATFQPVRRTQLPHPASIMVSGDFNGDRVADLALSEGADVRILLFDRSGQVYSDFVLVTGMKTASLIAGDFTGDGVPDLIAFGNRAGILLIVCDGKGAFGKARVIAGGPLRTVLEGDLNADGRKDLAVIKYQNYAEEVVAGLINDGKGIFHYESKSMPLGEATQFSLVDTNNDGMEDLLFGTEPTLSDVLGLAIRESDGFKKIVYFHEPDQVRAIRAADMNRDGRPDVLYLSDTGRFVVRLSLPNGRLSPPKITGSIEGFHKEMVVGDLNSDGWPDAILTGESETLMMVGNRNGGFYAARSIGFGVGNVAAADFNHDGFMDVAVAFTNIEILLGRSDSQFQKPFYIGTGTENNGNILALDLNRDGNADLVSSGDGLSIILGNGDGTFRPYKHYKLEAEYGNAVIAGDFNGDHIPDLAVRDADSIAIFLGNGDGSFSTRTLSQPAYSFEAIDLNQDGLTDIIVGANGQVILQLSLGDGSFRVAQSFSLEDATQFAGVDLNQDGRTDLVIGRYDQPTVMLRGNGDGTYGPFVLLSAGGLQARFSAGAVADYDGDGKPDFLSGEVVFLNRISTGSDSPQSWRFETRAYVGAFNSIAVDVNRDGVPDLVSPGNDSNALVILAQSCPMN